MHSTLVHEQCQPAISVPCLNTIKLRGWSCNSVKIPVKTRDKIASLSIFTTCTTTHHLPNFLLCRTQINQQPLSKVSTLLPLFKGLHHKKITRTLLGRYNHLSVSAQPHPLLYHELFHRVPKRHHGSNRNPLLNRRNRTIPFRHLRHHRRRRQLLMCPRTRRITRRHSVHYLLTLDLAQVLAGRILWAGGQEENGNRHTSFQVSSYSSEFCGNYVAH